MCHAEAIAVKGGTLILMDFHVGWDDNQQVKLVKYIVCQRVIVPRRVLSRRGSQEVLKRGSPFRKGLQEKISLLGEVYE